MTTVVLLVLALVWGALLVSWLRSRTEGGLADSVGTFRRHLSVLERAAPSTVRPANRLRSGPVAGRALPPYGAPLVRRPLPGARPAGATARRLPSAAVQRRRQVQKRRRDVFFALLAGVVGSLLLGIVPSLRVMLYVNLVSDVLFAFYVGLLIRLRNLAAEREIKLTFLPASRPPARPSGYALAGYDVVRPAYADLPLRRVN